MSKRLVVVGFSFLCSWLAVPTQGSLVSSARAAAPAESAGPRATLQRLNGACEKLLRMKTEPGSAEENRVKQEIKKNASALLDYGELCKRALGEHWDKMGEAKRTEFVSTLRELIERNYIRQLRTNLDYEVSYGDESADGKEAKVATTLKLATKGKTTQVQIDYRLVKQSDGTWKVYDVITDELSLVRNYRTQFTRIIGGNNYDGLLSRMKNKLSEEQAKDGPAKPTDSVADKKPEAVPPTGATPATATKPGNAPAAKPAVAPAGKTPAPAAKTPAPAAKAPAPAAK